MANSTQHVGRWCHRKRAQSEPLAALVSVAAVCLVVSLYVGAYTDVITQTGEDRELADPTADAIRGEIRSDGAFDAEIPIKTAVDRSTLPEGYAVAIEVVSIDEDGRQKQAGSEQFDASGNVMDLSPPGDTQRVTRPIPVRLQPGDVRPGRLVVEVWQ